MRDSKSDNAEQQLRDVLAEVAAKRLCGEDISDNDLLAQYPALAGRLREELSALARVEAARRVAAGASDASRAAVAGAGAPTVSSRVPGRAIPGYELLEEIHRGGQGVVYRALQRATGRPVAVKVLREGPFAGPRDRARFDREIHILAMLKHPNLITIYDSGEVDGLHYFAMDLIEGVRLDEFMTARRQATRDAEDAPAARRFIEASVQLFITICDAVQAAHLRGIIHRDLKPANILISGNIPKILDFGLAKSTDDGSDAAGGWTKMTQAGQFVGSLPWASPEQARGLAAIDVRTDVYALGVVFFQALTGDFPYPIVGELRTILDNIVRAEPRSPRACNAAIPEDVATIILKCLRKDPAERYQGVGDVARDLRLFLSGEPIEARGDNRWYILRKRLRKYRALVAGGIAATLLLSGFAVTMTLLYSWARGAESRAEARRQDAVDEARKAIEVREFLQNMLVAADPDTARGDDISVRELLDQAATQIEQQFHDAPEVEAALRLTLGQTYHNLGLDAKARPQIERAIECYRQSRRPDTTAMLVAEDALADICRTEGKFADAERRFREVLSRKQSVLGAEHDDTLVTMNNLAILLTDVGRYEEAEPLLDEVFRVRRARFGEDDPRTLSTLNAIGTLFHYGKEYERAISIFLRVANTRRRDLGVTHPATLVAMNNLAMSNQSARRYDDADAIYAELIDVERRVLGEDHRDTLRTRQNLAALRELQGRVDEALEMYLDIAARRRKALGNTHTQTLVTLEYIAGVYFSRQQYDRAEPLMHEVVEGRLAALGETNLKTLDAMNNLASVQLKAGRAAAAETWLRRAYETAAASRGPADNDTLAYQLHLSACLMDLGRWLDARELLSRALEFRRQAQPPDTRELVELQRSLGLCAQNLGQKDEARRQFEAAFSLALEKLGREAAETKSAAESYAEFLDESGDGATAQSVRSGVRDNPD